MRKILVIIISVISSVQIMGQSMEWLCRPNKYTDIKYMGYDLFKVGIFRK